MRTISESYIGTVCGLYRRTYTNCTQEDVAEQLGVDRSMISKFETGTRQHAKIFMWYIKNGIFDWKPVEYWNGWEDL